MIVVDAPQRFAADHERRHGACRELYQSNTGRNPLPRQRKDARCCPYQTVVATDNPPSLKQLRADPAADTASCCTRVTALGLVVLGGARLRVANGREMARRAGEARAHAAAHDVGSVMPSFNAHLPQYSAFPAAIG